jgi:restriction system protein
MGKQSKAVGRAARRREDAAFKLLATGVVFVIVPLALRASPLGKGISAIVPLGFIVLVVGALLLFVGRQRKAGRAPARSHPEYVPTLLTRLDVPEEDLVSAELERASEEAKLRRRGRPTPPASWGPGVFDAIEWRRFEAVVETLFQQAGLETKSQSHGADGGVDVWLYSRQQAEVPVGLVQCKHWSGKEIGVDKIRELRGVMAANKVGRGVFATTSSFTTEAAKFGRENGIDLLDVDRLLVLIAKRTPEQQRALLVVALEGDYWRPTCVNCGTKMVERTPRKGGNAFWGCAHYPRCSRTLPMRAASKE